MLKPLAPVGPPGDSHIAASLTQHLLSQNAPRAAARVSGHEPTQPEPCAYAVAPDSVTLVDTAALAARFSPGSGRSSGQPSGITGAAKHFLRKVRGVLPAGAFRKPEPRGLL